METTTKTQTIPTLVFDAPEPELPVVTDTTAEIVVPQEEKLDETILTPEEQKAIVAEKLG